MAILDLLFFDNAQFAEKLQVPLFDAVMHWIDFVKAETSTEKNYAKLLEKLH
ncbi:unnamed protein product, partial [Callosobruchus maculatus]